MRESRAWQTPGTRQVFDLPHQPEAEHPVVKLCSLILTEGITSSATKIQLEHGDQFGSVRMEVAGTWRDVMRIPVQAFEAVVNRLKIMAELDVSKRPGQQGTIFLRHDGREITASVSTALTVSMKEHATVEFSPSP